MGSDEERPTERLHSVSDMFPNLEVGRTPTCHTKSDDVKAVGREG
jgi:hypothetical protein